MRIKKNIFFLKIHIFSQHHNGTEINSGLHLAFGPQCRMNQDYSRRLRHSFVLGQSPPGFPVSLESNFADRATVDYLTDKGRLTMDFDPIQDFSLQ